MAKKDIGKLISNRLNEINQVPDDAVWDSIENSLNKNKEYKKPATYFLKRYGIPSLVVAMMFFVFNYYETDSTGKNQKDNNSIKKSVIVTKEKDTLKEKPVVQIDKSTVPEENLNTKKEEIIKNDKNNTANVLKKRHFKSASKSNVKTNRFIKTNSHLKHSSKNKLKQKTSNQKKGDSKKNNLKTFEYKTNTTAKNTKVVYDKTENNEQYNTLKEEDALIKKNKKRKETINKKAKDSIKEQPESKGSYWIVSTCGNFTFFDASKNASLFGNSIQDYMRNNQITINYGVYVGLKVTKGLSIRSGAFKTSLDYTVKPLSKINHVTAVVNTPALKSFLNNNASFYIKQRLDYLEIPLEFTYAIYDKKIVVYPMLGLSYLHLKKNKTIFYSSSTAIETVLKKVKPLNISANFGLGFGFKFFENLHFSTEALFKKQFLALDNTHNFSPYTLSLMFGFNYNFKNK